MPRHNRSILFIAATGLKGAADLQVAGGGCVVDLHVGVVGRGQLDVFSEPKHRGAGVSLHLAADVCGVALPGVHHHVTQDLWSICGRTQGNKDASHLNRRVWDKIQ